jgi:hypothetical protein
MVDENGDSLRSHYESIWRQSGEKPPELEPVECPKEVKYIWEYWLSLERRRQGHNPVSWSDIGWWCFVKNISLSAFEEDMLNKIESLYFKELKSRIPKPDAT